MNRSSCRAFSLIEVLIALLVFAVGVLAVVSLQTTALRAASRAQTLTAASALAQGALEQLQALPATDPKVTTAGESELWNDVSLAGGGSYRATVLVEPGVPVSGTTRLSVTVASQGRTVTVVGFKKAL